MGMALDSQVCGAAIMAIKVEGLGS